MLYDKHFFKGIISQHSCHYTKEGNATVPIDKHLHILKQLKLQQHAQLHRNKCYKQIQLYKCGVQATIPSWDVTAVTILLLDLFNHSSLMNKVAG